MTKVKEFAGIDISKETFDVAIPTGKAGEYRHKQFSNNSDGFRCFKKILPIHCVCVMEASGSYYLPLANYLHKGDIEVNVVNPLSVSHFAKMRMKRAKTDKKDAAIIAEYGRSEQPATWQPKEDYLLELQQLQAVLDGFVQRKTALANQREAFMVSGAKKQVAFNTIKSEINHVEKKIEKIEAEMERITQEHHAEMFDQLKSIPGIGKRTAMMLIVITDGFTKFQNAKQLVAYIGLSPRIYESGTSVKGKSRICKMGMNRMRWLLYMCSMNAKNCNESCKQMFDRLKLKGKNGKLILIAIANKLVRQAFAVAKGKRCYEVKLV